MHINWTIQAALNMAFPRISKIESWPRFCKNNEIWRPTSIVLQVSWQKPPSGKIKENTDGSYFKEIGKAIIRGIVRDEQRELIMALSLTAQCTTNNTAEATATKMGIQW